MVQMTLSTKASNDSRASKDSTVRLFSLFHFIFFMPFSFHTQKATKFPLLFELLDLPKGVEITNLPDISGAPPVPPFTKQTLEGESIGVYALSPRNLIRVSNLQSHETKVFEVPEVPKRYYS